MHNPALVRPLILLVVAASLVPAAGRARGAAAAVRDDSAGARRALEVYGGTPMAFEPNVGQADARVKYLARGRGYTLFLTDDGATLSLGISRPSGAAEALRLSIEGARPEARVAASRELPGKVNYLRGETSEWRRGVPTYAAVRYEGVYPGVDAVFYGNQSRLEYDFVVAPGADPSQVRVKFEGQQAIDVAEDGSLRLALAGGEVRQRRAVVYQQGAAGKREVEARYVLGADGEVSFDLGEYDPTLPLTIDPVLDYEVFLGGAWSFELAEGVALGPDGSVYVTGWTSATNFPTTPGAYDWTLAVDPFTGGRDAFVTRLSADGAALIYSTYLGGSGVEQPTAIAVDAAGNAYVAGATLSADFPTTPGAFDRTFGGTQWPATQEGDGFVAKLDASGATLLYSTFVGAAGGDRANAVAVDASGAAIVGGYTYSTDFPTTPGAFDTAFGGPVEGVDGFLMKLSPSGGSLQYSTFVGGASGDFVEAVAADAAGNAYVAGNTGSTDFPASAGAYDTSAAGGWDAFVAKFSPSGARVYATYLGGGEYETVGGVAVDASGAAYLAGSTESNASFPTTPGAYVYHVNSSGYVAKLSPAGDALVFSAKVGGTHGMQVSGVARDPSGAVHVAGITRGPMPTTAGALDTTWSIGDEKAYALKLSADGSTLSYATYLGNSWYQPSGGVAVDAEGRAYVVGMTGDDDFPSTPGAFDPTHNGGYDAFVVRLNADASGLEFGTFLSGANSVGSETLDEARAIAVDASGAVYLAGTTDSATFPVAEGAADGVRGGAYDVFVTKLDPQGSSVVFSTYLGGEDFDYGQAVAVGADGAVYVAGGTSSPDFPLTAGAADTTIGGTGDYLVPAEGFVAKLAPDGSSLEYATLVGGAHDDGCLGLALRGDGAAVVAGWTESHDFPVSAGAYDTTYGGNEREDGFVAAVSADGSSFLYSTYLGDAAEDFGRAVALDAAGAVYVTGETRSPNFPTTPGAFDRVFGGFASSTSEAFVTKLSPEGGEVVFSSFLGGSGFESGNAIAVGAGGTVYLAGATYSPDFPTTPGAFDTSSPHLDHAISAAFVSKVNPEGTALVYSTFVGEPLTSASGLAVAGDGTAWVGGTTRSLVFPVTLGAYDTTLGDGGQTGDRDGFLAGVAADGSALVYGTYLGGSGDDDLHALAADAAGSVYAAGQARAADFAEGGFGHRDGSNAFVARLSPVPGPPLSRDSAGVYVPATGAWFVRNANVSGPADLAFSYGPGGAGLVPLSGDWDGDGVDTPGLYAPATGAFFLKNSSGAGGADLVFTFGAGGAGVVPLAGDWNGDGVDTVGIYVEATGVFFLRNQNSSGPASQTLSFGPGGEGVVPVTGRYGGNQDTVGIYVEATGTFFLRAFQGPGPADASFSFGPPGAVPISGDWDVDGIDTIGIYVPETGAWFLRDQNAPGGADEVFTYGPPGAVPLSGNWDGQ